MTLDPKYLILDYWLKRDDIVCKTDDGEEVPKDDEDGVLVYLRVCTTCGTSLTVCTCAAKTGGLALVWDGETPQEQTIQAIQDAANRVYAVAVPVIARDPIPAFPAELKSMAGWGVYRIEDGARNGRPVNLKTPYNARTGAQGNPFTVRSASSFAEACGALEASRSTDSPYRGLAFGFIYENGLTGIDIDDCRDANTGIILPWAMEIIKEANSYTEISVSGTGVHIVVKGWRIPSATEGGKQGRRCGIEMYSGKHYFTVSGNHLTETPTTVETRDLSNIFAKLQSRYYEQFTKRDETAEPVKSAEASTERLDKPKTDNNQVLPLGSTVKKLDLLMRGEITSQKPFRLEYNGASIDYESQSEADQALCNRLAWSFDSMEEIEIQFRNSVLYRDKWERADYRASTITQAIKKRDEVLAANDTDKVSDILLGGVFINGPKRGQNLKGEQVANPALPINIPFPVPVIVVPAAGSYTNLLAELGIARASWIETNIPRAYDLSSAPNKWRLQDFIFDTGLHLFSGKEGSMKTMLAFIVANALCRGEDLFGKANFGEKLTVVYVDRENPRSEMRKRAAALGLLELDNFHIWGDWDVHNLPPADFSDVRLIEQARRNPLTFFMFDSLSSFLNGSDENDAGEMTQLMGAGRSLARQCAGVGILHHRARKPGKGVGARGSTAIVAATDVAYIIEKESDTVSIMPERFRFSSPWTVKFEMNWGGLSGKYSHKLVSENGKAVTVDSVAKAKAEADAVMQAAARTAERERVLYQAKTCIETAYKAAVAGTGECISSRSQLASLLGLHPEGSIARELLTGGADKPWNVVPGQRKSIIFLPKHVQVPPTKVERKPARKTDEKQAIPKRV